MTDAVGFVLLFCLYYHFKFQSIFCMTKMFLVAVTQKNSIHISAF